jgi:Ca2+/Na+ antiporter
MVKTGGIGILLFLVFAINLLLKASRRIRLGSDHKTAFILLLATIIAVYFTTLVVNGFFSGESFFMLLFIGYLYEFLFNNTKSDENKHNNSNVQCGIEIKQVP